MIHLLKFAFAGLIVLFNLPVIIFSAAYSIFMWDSKHWDNTCLYVGHIILGFLNEDK